MTKDRIIVVGASAGGVESLIAFSASLPPALNAAIFVVMHLSPNYVSKLPEILNRNGPLPAKHPIDGEKIKSGQIYVALPDHHLLIENDRMVVARGPKENRSRPSIDALFRSAAYHYQERVIGIVLSGALDDGTSGLWNIKRMGGIAITQDPAECTFDSMPASAMQQVEIDFTLSASKMGQLLDSLTCNDAQMKLKKPDIDEKSRASMGLEVSIAAEANAFERGVMSIGTLSPFACPECHGVLIEIKEGKHGRFRCHTGHAYSCSALISAFTEAVGESYWKAMRGLEETAILLEKAGKELQDDHQLAAADEFRQQALLTRQQAIKLRDVVLSSNQYSGDSLLDEVENKNK